MSNYQNNAINPQKKNGNEFSIFRLGQSIVMIKPNDCGFLKKFLFFLRLRRSTSFGRFISVYRAEIVLQPEPT